MKPGLPEKIRFSSLPVDLSVSQFEASGLIPLRRLGKLKELLLDDGGDVQLSIRIYRDHARRLLMDGQLDATLSMACQRCLGQVETDVSHPIALQLVLDDEAARSVMREREPWIYDEEILVSELVEEELLLALPFSVLHESADDCDPDGPTWQDEPLPEAGEMPAKEEKRSPFSDLRKQLNLDSSNAGKQD